MKHFFSKDLKDLLNQIMKGYKMGFEVDVDDQTGEVSGAQSEGIFYEYDKPIQIIQYIRKGGRKKKGVMVAFAEDNKFYIGYMLCDNKDKFDKTIAIKGAKTRAVRLDEDPDRIIIPLTVRKHLPEFIDRCKRYYKDKEMTRWPETWGLGRSE